MLEMIYKHEFIKDAVIAIETGLLYIFGPFTEGDVYIAGLLLMAVVMLILRDIDVGFFRKLKREQRLMERMEEEAARADALAGVM